MMLSNDVAPTLSYTMSKLCRGRFRDGLPRRPRVARNCSWLARRLRNPGLTVAVKKVFYKKHKNPTCPKVFGNSDNTCVFCRKKAWLSARESQTLSHLLHCLKTSLFAPGPVRHLPCRLLSSRAIPCAAARSHTPTLPLPCQRASAARRSSCCRSGRGSETEPLSASCPIRRYPSRFRRRRGG